MNVSPIGRPFDGVTTLGSEKKCRAVADRAPPPCWVHLVRPDGKVEETYSKTVALGRVNHDSVTS